MTVGAGPFDAFELRVRGTVRPCREDDLERLEWFGAFAHHRAIFREAFELSRQDLAIMLVAEVNGFPVGQAWLDLQPRAEAEGPMVWAVRVLEPFQGLGIGMRLMCAVEALAGERGCRVLEVGVERSNPAARAFYERQGWRVARERRGGYSYRLPSGEEITHSLDEWVMTKPLDQAGGGSPTRA